MFLATSNHYKDSSPNNIFEGPLDLSLSAREFENKKGKDASGNEY